jgi:hypothetical protein
MTEDKKGFLLYKDLIHTVEKMPDDKAGLLFKHILQYVNDNNPETDDLIIQLTFEPIKQQLKRDLKKYKDALDGKSNAGKIGNLKRWHNDLFKDYDSGKITLDEALLIAENRKQSHSDDVQSQTITKIAVKDTVTVTDTVTDNVNDILLKKETKKDSVIKHKKKDIVFPFDSEDFLNNWNEWKQYKKSEHSFSYKSESTELKTIESLFKDSNGNEKLAIEMINNAIAKNWKGIYKINNDNNGKQFTRLTADEQLAKRFAEIDKKHGINQEQDVSKTISERTIFDDYEEIP